MILDFMKKPIFFLFCFSLISLNILSQRIKNIENLNQFGGNQTDSLRSSERTKVKLSGKTKYTDYKIISHNRDTSFIDTTLTLKKHYKYNYLRKDNFELLQFHNQGQTNNNLGYSFNNIKRLPDFGFSAKQFPYLEIEDIKYYEVPLQQQK